MPDLGVSAVSAIHRQGGKDAAVGYETNANESDAVNYSFTPIEVDHCDPFGVTVVLLEEEDGYRATPQASRDRRQKALRHARTSQEPVSLASIARAVGVSTNFIYRHPTLRPQVGDLCCSRHDAPAIGLLRTPTPKPPPAP